MTSSLATIVGIGAVLLSAVGCEQGTAADSPSSIDPESSSDDSENQEEDRDNSLWGFDFESGQCPYPRPRQCAERAPSVDVEGLLATPAVQEVLMAIEEAGQSFPLHQGLEPPQISGFYLSEAGGENVLSGDGTNLGAQVPLNQGRVVALPEKQLINTAFLSQPKNGSNLFTQADISHFRGQGQEFTVYASEYLACSLPSFGGSTFASQQLTVLSGVVDEKTGDLVQLRRLSVNIMLHDEDSWGEETSLSEDCAVQIVGNLETVGGWVVQELPRAEKVAPADLTYFCQDKEGILYTPREGWVYTESGDNGPYQVTCDCSGYRDPSDERSLEQPTQSCFD